MAVWSEVFMGQVTGPLTSLKSVVTSRAAEVRALCHERQCSAEFWASLPRSKVGTPSPSKAVNNSFELDQALTAGLLLLPFMP
mmetsp:Transcript_80861/g.156128  ORF Transcript_80861/g.156128 Transcript_80861/m.156128 type:complete len:83 (-) Transcript_80861:17-265(-)